MKCIVLVVLCLAYAEAGAIPSGSRDPSSEQEKLIEAAQAVQADLVRRVCQGAGPLLKNCRTYFCTEAGVVAFRDIAGCVPELPAGGKCEPGTIAAVDCNTCVCTEIGTLVCTEKNCNTPEAKIPVPMNALFDSVRQNRNLVTKTNAGANTEELKRQYSKENLEYLDNSEENSKKTIYEEENSNQDKPEHSFEELDNAHVELKYSLDDIHSIEEHNNVLEETDRIKDKHNVLKRSVCKLNQVFQMECNTCKCAPDGQSFTCTQNECMEGDKNKEVEVFMEGEGVDHSERHSVCKPLSTFYIGCNTCHCNQYGTDYSCTNKPCPLPEDVELFHELKAIKSSKNDSQKIVCVANRMFIKDCNTCWCNEDGTSFICTRKVCVPELPELGTEEEKTEDHHIIKKECRPDEVFELDCNMCRCNPDGKSFSCTRRACVDRVDEDVKSMDTLKSKNVYNRSETVMPYIDFFSDHRPTDVLPFASKSLPENVAYLNYLNNNYGNTPKESTVKSDNPPKQVCTPYDMFEQDCNMCLCDSDGRSFSCTRTKCFNKRDLSESRSIVVETPEVNTELARETRKKEEEPLKICDPEKEFRMDCNRCICDIEGLSFSCTRLDCNIHNVGRRKREAEMAVCIPKDSFKLGCNTCECNNNGQSFVCSTANECVEHHITKREPSVPGSLVDVMRVDGDMQTTPSIRRTRGVTQPTPMSKSSDLVKEALKTCQPGQEFRMDCNRCLCDSEGLDFSCTRIDCNAQNGKSRRRRETSEQVTMKCSPGSVFDVDCNVCRCTSDGHHAMCTVKWCGVSTTVNNDLSAPQKKPRSYGVTDSDPNFRCNPGEQFKRDCNDCTCSADGKSVFCTVRFCDQGVTPPSSL